MDSLLFHPKVVHIPIALGVLMPLLAGGLLLAWWRGWLPARSWVLAVALQAVLVGSGVAALRSGEAEEERVERAVPERVLEAHEEAAEGFVGASGVVLGMMLLALVLGRSRAGLPTAAAATLGTLAVLGLASRTGQAGGELVYRHGAASVYVSAAEGTPRPSSSARVRFGGDDDEEGEDDD